MKKLLIPFIALLFLCFSINAQEKSRKEMKGDKYAFTYSFAKAIDAYSHAKQLSPEGQRSLAESYYKINRNVEAEAAYLKLINAGKGLIPDDYYNYAMVLKSNGNYAESNIWMDKFAGQKPLDLRVADYNANKTELSPLQKDDGKYKIVHLNANTSALDFGTSYYKDKIVFSSTKSSPKMIVRNYNWTGKPYWDMYVSEVNDRQLTSPKQLDKQLNDKLHEGPASFNKEGNYMAYTRNNPKDKSSDDVVELQLCFSSLSDGKWSAPEPFALNNANYSVGQPCLSADGNTLYFTSDMPGGFGGADLYRVTRAPKGQWGAATNLGNTINTEGDEMYPFLEETNGVLFFSSNGRYGLGGLDIFISPLDGNGFGPVVNAGTPLNTQYNDYAAIADNKLSTGYFTSDRPSGSGGDDIYSADIFSLDIGKKINVIAKDANGMPVPQAYVRLIDDKNRVIDSTYTNDEGTCSFLVDTDKNFKITGNKANYIEGSSVVNTFGKDFITKAEITMNKEVEIVPEPAQVIAEVPKTTSLPTKFNFDETIYFDLDKYDIRPDAEIELKKIVKILNEYPDMILELGSHADSRGTKAYNQVLSERREKATADYLKQRISRPERVYGRGFGETELVNNCAGEGSVVSDCQEKDHQKNRRTEFTIVKK